LGKQARAGHWALGIGKIYKAIFAQIMNNFYSLLLLSSSLFLRAASLTRRFANAPSLFVKKARSPIMKNCYTQEILT